MRQKFEKVQGYARTLTNQRKEAEDEISRLNEVLSPITKDWWRHRQKNKGE